MSERSAPQQRDQNDIRQAIRQHAANPSLRKLVTAGCDESQLLTWLAALQPSGAIDETWKGLVGQAWPGQRGDFKKKFESSLREIRQCGALIKRLESTEFFRLFFRPGDLVLTGRALDGYAEKLTRTLALVGPKKRPLRFLAKALLVLHVKEATGQLHDEAVSALIAAATGERYGAHAHVQWRRDNRMLIDMAALLRQARSSESHQLI